MKNQSLRKYVLPIVLALTLIATAIQTFLLVVYYDKSDLLYKHCVPDVPQTILWVLFALTLVISIWLSLTIKSGRNVQPKHVSPIAWAGASILVPALIAFCAFSLFVNITGDRVPALISEVSDSSGQIRSMVFATYLAKYGAYLAILAAVFPAVMLITQKANPTFAIFTSVWSMTVALRSYFDIDTPMNDPLRLLRIVGFAGAVLAFCLETRGGLHRLTDRLAVILGSTAFFATTVSSVPTIICCVANRMIQTDLFGAFALLGTSLITLDRIAAVSRAKRHHIHSHDTRKEPAETTATVEAGETQTENGEAQ